MIGKLKATVTIPTTMTAKAKVKLKARQCFTQRDRRKTNATP